MPWPPPIRSAGSGEPDDVAEAIRWLCSPANAWISGVELTVDGGFTVT